jgi:hypothetical protein
MASTFGPVEVHDAFGEVVVAFGLELLYVFGDAGLWVISMISGTPNG